MNLNELILYIKHRIIEADRLSSTSNDRSDPNKEYWRGSYNAYSNVLESLEKLKKTTEKKQ